MSGSKFVKANEQIAETVTSGFQKIEDSVVGAFKKVEDAFVDKYLTHEGETVEDAEKRLAEEQAAREAASKGTAASYVESLPHGADIGKASVAASLERGKASVEASKNAGKH